MKNQLKVGKKYHTEGGHVAHVTGRKRTPNGYYLNRPFIVDLYGPDGVRLVRGEWYGRCGALMPGCKHVQDIVKPLKPIEE